MMLLLLCCLWVTSTCKIDAPPQTAAGSVVGRSTIAIAKRKGIKTINVVRRAEQKQELLDLGCVALSSRLVRVSAV